MSQDVAPQAPGSLPLLWIAWVDSDRAGRNWTSIKEFTPAPTECISVGFLIHEDDDTITVSGNVGLGLLEREGEEGTLPISFVHGITIPKCSILKREECHEP